MLPIQEAKNQTGDMLKMIYRPCMGIVSLHGKVLFVSDSMINEFPTLQPGMNVLSWITETPFVKDVDTKEIITCAKEAVEENSIKTVLMIMFDKSYVPHLWHIGIIPRIKEGEDTCFIILGVNMDFANTAFDRDVLTGCQTRGLFLDTAELFLNQEPNSYLGFLDIDSFKGINDNYGHDVGDEILVQTARFLERMMNSFHCKGHLCRYGGDEFCFVFKSEWEDFDPAKFHRIVSDGFLSENKDIPISVRYSLGLIKNDASGLENIILQADKEMYVNKKAKKVQRA